MKSQSRNALAPGLVPLGPSNTGVEPLQQGLIWNDPAAYEAISGLQQIDPEVGKYFYNPETRMFHPVYAVDRDPFEGQGTAQESSDDDQTDEATS